MGQLRGHVSVLAFPDLIQHLVAQGKSGTLLITQASMQKSIYLGPDGMRLLSATTRKTSSLGEILIRTRKITRVQLDQMLVEQQQTGKRLGELISRRGTVTKQDVETALREQAQEEIYDLFTWLEADFAFEEGPAPSRAGDFLLAEVVVDASPTTIMLEAARRADELATVMKVVRNESLIPIRTKKPFAPQGHGLHPDLLATIYNHVNGRMDIAEVVRMSLFPRFEALRAIYVLTTKEFIKIIDREGATAIHLASDKLRVRPGAGAAVAPNPWHVPAGKRRSVLLLGDMSKFRQALAAVLREAGYDVLEEVAAKANSFLMGDRKADAVILDVALASHEDYQFISWLCENTRSPVLVLSGDVSREAAETAVKRGVRAYIAKPFTRDSLLRALSGVFI